MSLIHRSFILLAMLFLSQTLVAAPIESNLIELNQSKSLRSAEKDSFQYLPIDKDFWNTFLEQSPSKTLDFALSKTNNSKPDSEEYSEARLAVAKALYDQKLTWSAIALNLDILNTHKDNQFAYLAMIQLEEIYRKEKIFIEALNSELLALNLSNLPEPALSFYSYLKAIDRLKKGFSSWAKVQLNAIQENSFWYNYYLYQSAMSSLQDKEAKKGLEILDHLVSFQDEDLNNQVHWQKARLHFENGNFKESIEHYLKVEPDNLRQTARLNLEMAWARFYNKDFAEALGKLRLLKGSFLKSAQSSEAYLLEMLIYRDLCKYDYIEGLRQSFESNYANTIKHISLRKPLSQDQYLFNNSVLNLDYQTLANQIHQINQEYQKIDLKTPLQAKVRSKLKSWFTSFDLHLNRVLEDELKLQANRLLNQKQQVQFISYTSKLEKSKISKPIYQSNYQAQTANKIKFDKLYWPVKTEIWKDEIPFIKVQISSECNEEVSKYRNSVISVGDEV